MTEAQMRADMLMARLIQTERVWVDTRQQVAVVPKVTAPLVDARTIGNSPRFTGEHKDWLEWSFQSTQHTWDPRIPSRLKHCTGLRWRKTRLLPSEW